MHPQRQLIVWVNVLGGVAVLGSYAYGVWVRAAGADALWGGVPQRIRPVYGVGMLLAALGYLAFSHLIVIRLDPASVRIAGRYGYRLFIALYAAILVPSALWMPLTVAMVERPGDGVWIAIRLVLAVVGVASLVMVGALVGLQPRTSAWSYWLAVGGSAVFCIHTLVLDALVWPALFG